jgi:hypothetical protein
MIKTTKLEREVIEVRLKDSFDKSKHAEVKTTLDVITDYNKIEEAVIKLHRKYEDLFVTEYRYKRNSNNKDCKKRLEDDRLSFMVDFDNFIDLFSNLSDIQDQKIETDDVLKQLGWEAIRGTDNHGVYPIDKAKALKASSAQVAKLKKPFHTHLCFQCKVNSVSSSNTLCQSCLYQSQSSNANANANAKPCARCQNIHTSAGSHCPSCKAYNSSRNISLCIQCHQNPRQYGTLCDHCYQVSTHVAHHNKSTHSRSVYSSGVNAKSCMMCQTPHNSTGTLCASCSASFYQSIHSRSIPRTTICSACGISHVVAGTQFCAKCSNVSTSSATAKLCIQCNQRPQHYGTICKDCYDLISNTSSRALCACNLNLVEPGETMCSWCLTLQQKASTSAQQLSKSVSATPVATPAPILSYPTHAQIKSVVAANFNVKSSQTAPIKKSAIKSCFDYILKLILK